MAFEGLTEKLSATFKKLRGKGRLKESDVKEAMREIRLALLEADVSYKVVKDFTKSVTERCIGTDVLESLTPAQMIVKIVNEELTRLMGERDAAHYHQSQGADCGDAGGPSGRGQNHQRLQAGRSHEKAGQKSSAGGLRHLPSGRHPAAGGLRRKIGLAGVSNGPDQSGGHCQGGGAACRSPWQRHGVFWTRPAGCTSTRH